MQQYDAVAAFHDASDPWVKLRWGGLQSHRAFSIDTKQGPCFGLCDKSPMISVVLLQPPWRPLEALRVEAEGAFFRLPLGCLRGEWTLIAVSAFWHPLPNSSQNMTATEAWDMNLFSDDVVPTATHI